MSEKCVHCGICKKSCALLQKYNTDIGDTEKLRELAYQCFLCGKCTEVCPRGIDGREIMLKMRQDKQDLKGYTGLLAEKRNYLFKNYRHGRKKSVLFPGCNFPSFYPRTMKMLVDILKEKADMGVIYDCCGKPVAELGLVEDEERIINRINEKLKELRIEEVVMICPNCYSFLKSKLDAKVVSVYEKLTELGFGKKLDGEIELFLPCPERMEREMLETIRPFLPEEIKIEEEIICCGLGGCAGYKEPELAKELASSMRGRKIYTYCASCASNFARNGCDEVYHILAEILKTNEIPDKSRSFINRVKTKFA